MSKPTTRRVATTYTAPSDWAPYFINGDDSGLSDVDREAADRFLARVNLGAPVACEDAGFKRYHDARPECPFAADCQVYTFLTDV